MKYEWKSMNKILFSLNLLIILLTIIGCCILSTDLFDKKEAFPLALLLALIYALSLMTFSCVTLVYVYVRFYKNLFTAEGYLMHTLPVTGSQLFHSKLTTGFFFVSLNSVLTLLSTMVLGFAAGYHAEANSNADELLAFFSEGEMESLTFANIFGYSPVIFISLILLMLLTSSLASLLMGYVSILLGQLVEKYRLAASIGFYLAIYLVNQTLSSVVILLPNMQFLISSAEDTSLTITCNFFRTLLPACIISQLAASVLLYIASLLLIRRRVNLE